jgi:RHS repeat-associated protein
MEKSLKLSENQYNILNINTDSSDWYVYGARFYDPQIGRTTTCDPHAENYNSDSPYSFLGNNPLLNIDPDGMDWYTNWFTGKQVWYDGSDKHLFYSHNEGGYYSSPIATVTDYSNASIHQQAEDFASTQRFLQTLNEAGIQTERTNSRTVALASWISLGALPEFKGISSLLKIFKGTSKNTIKGVEELITVANTQEKSGLTTVGRALQKHGSRAGSSFPKVVGSPEAINAQGETVLKEILTNPSVTTDVRHHARFGEVLEYRIPGGQGARFSSDGKKFFGFLEPHE